MARANTESEPLVIHGVSVSGRCALPSRNNSQLQLNSQAGQHALECASRKNKSGINDIVMLNIQVTKDDNLRAGLSYSLLSDLVTSYAAIRPKLSSLYRSITESLRSELR